MTTVTANVCVKRTHCMRSNINTINAQCEQSKVVRYRHRLTNKTNSRPVSYLILLPYLATLDNSYCKLTVDEN